MLTFDVETMPNYHPYPILACAASLNGWYVWISPWLLGHSASPQHLIPFGDPTIPRVIVGHNVSYDRGRILEEYNFVSAKNRLIDTVALHVAVKGIPSHQRPAWMKYRKSKQTQLEQQQEAIEAVVELLATVDQRLKAEADIAKKEELRQRREDMAESLSRRQFSTQPDIDVDIDTPEVELSLKRWEDLTSANSLADVAKLHCGIDMDRSDFMTSTPIEILDNIAD